MSITLVSKDGEKFTVSRAIGNMSNLIKNATEDNPDSNEDLELTEIASPQLKAFIDYATHFDFAKETTDIVAPLVSTKPEEFIKDEWERKFISQFDKDFILDLLEAMNFLDSKALFELCCATIAADFKGKEFEEIKKQYGLDDVEYTPEDEEEIMREYPWIMEETEARIKKLREENGL